MDVMNTVYQTTSNDQCGPRLAGTRFSWIAVMLLASVFFISSCEDPLGLLDEDEENGDNGNGEEEVEINAVVQIDPQEPMVGDEVLLDGTESEVSGSDSPDYTWELQAPADSDAQIDDPSAEATFFEPDVGGDYEVTLTIEANGESDSDAEAFHVEDRQEEELSSDITESRTLESDVRYVVTGELDIDNGAFLTIEAGTQIEFESGAGLRVHDNSSALIAEGTADEPIRMYGSQQVAGHWTGLNFNSNNPENLLEHVVIEHAGGDNFFRAGTSNVSTREGGEVTIQHSLIRESGAVGLHVDSNGDLSGFQSNTFEDNESEPVVIPTRLMGTLDGESSYSGNGADYIAVYSQDVESDMNVVALDVPYRLDGEPDIEGETGVTIEEGVTMEFRSDAGLRVHDNNAYLAIEGSEDNPVTITGTLENPGHWMGINFNSTHPNNEINHAVIEHGGSDNFYRSRTATVSTRESAQLSITNTQINNGGRHGLGISSATDVNIFESNSFEGNQGSPVVTYTNQMGVLDSDSDYTGNEDEFVEIRSEDVTSDMNVASLNVPYRLSGEPDIDSDAGVTIEAGAELEFTSDSGIRVHSNDAYISVEGTEDAPVVFTGSVEDEGWWKGVNINSGHPNNRFDHAIVEYGGSDDDWFRAQPANISLRSDGNQFEMTNSTIRFSGEYGFHAESGNDLNDGICDDDVNTFENNEGSDCVIEN